MYRRQLCIGAIMSLAGCSAEPTATGPSAPPAAATALASYTSKDLGSLGGGTGSAADVNNAGQIVGASSVARNGPGHAFLWQNGVMRDLGTLGGSSSGAYAINTRGQVVGYSETAAGQTHAFLWDKGVMHDLGTLGGLYSEAWGINDSGQVVGRATIPSGVTRAFIWSKGTMERVPGLEKLSSLAFGISSAGVVVGHYNSGAGVHAFRARDGILTDLGTLGGRGSGALAVRGGMIVGSAQGMGGNQAVVWRNGMIANLNVSGRSSVAEALNASGQIVGHRLSPVDLVHYAFLWENGSARDLGPGLAYGINRSGWIVGERTVGDDIRPTLWKPN